MKRFVMFLLVCLVVLGSVMPAYAQYNPYTCAVKGCDNPQWGSNYCKEHKCKMCNLRRNADSELCNWCRTTAVCKYNNCGKYVSFPNGACEEHMCKEGGNCGNIKKEGYNMCARHLGLVPKHKAYEKSYSYATNKTYSYNYEEEDEDSYSESEKKEKRSDPNDCCDYSNGDDFADEWADEFDGDCWEDRYDDAYDYWQAHH